MNAVLGWDIGGVNTKGARVAQARVVATGAVPYELQRDPAALTPLLRRLARDIGARPGDAHAVTMTAELSQLFRTKREGVGFVLDAVAAAFVEECVRVWTVDARWLTLAQARREPHAVAAANWSATAQLVARLVPDCVLIDVGSTTTDIVPIAGGVPRAAGVNDTERLREGELVYTGALRTPTEAIAATVPVCDRPTGVSAEGFALAGDVHLWRGELAPEDYSVPTPDGRPATRAFAGERLMRVVCADREMLDDDGVDAIADALWDAQATRLRDPVLGMDQYAHALAARIPDAVLVDGAGGVAAALQAGRLPVLAPYRWLRADDPLPHSWDVTSDSIAAWFAGALGARRIVLIKPADGEHKKLVDSHFLRALPSGVEHLIVTADDRGQLDGALREAPERERRGGRRADQAL